MWFQGANRSIDSSVIGKQVAALKDEICIQKFFTRACQPIRDADDDVNLLMAELELSNFNPSADLLNLNRKKAEELYGSVTKDIAAWKRAELGEEAKAKEEKLAKAKSDKEAKQK